MEIDRNSMTTKRLYRLVSYPNCRNSDLRLDNPRHRRFDIAPAPQYNPLYIDGAIMVRDTVANAIYSNRHLSVVPRGATRLRDFPACTTDKMLRCCGQYKLHTESNKKFHIEEDVLVKMALLLLMTTCQLFVAQTVLGQENTRGTQNIPDASDGDIRHFVAMPAQARELMRKEMLNHMSALNEVIGYLASNQLDAAANLAESRMGKSSMGKHRGTGMGPGRFMPLEMRNIGWGMHEAATELSNHAKQGDVKGAYAALQKITSSCVACHYSYRTR